MNSRFDAVVVGSGPNGLAAAIALQQKGLAVKVIEAKPTPGGGMRSMPLTLPGFVHDVCSAVHPMGIYSPFFNSLPLQEHGLEWVNPELALAHPFLNGEAAVMSQSFSRTAASLGVDGDTYIRFMKPLAETWENIGPDLLGPLNPFPKHPIDLAKFGLNALQSATGLANRLFKEQYAKGLLAGLAAHSVRPLEHGITSAIGLVLAVVGHKYGWPFPKGGTQKLADALVSYFRSIGGEVETDHPVTAMQELEFAKIKLFDITPRQLLQIQGLKFPTLYKKQLENYRYGPGIFKIDYALSEPIPFKAADCNKAGTVHIGGTIEEIAISEREAWEGKHSEKPYILLSQHSLFDATRAPEGKHTGWAYCHVPKGSTLDMTAAIENQIESFAPGFKDVILERHTMHTAEVNAYNANYIAGDITGGVTDLRQLFTRPAIRISPYSTPLSDVYICSSSTPPGAGVHGMCGFYAARRVLKDHYGISLKL
ncbi:NAD(P)/FAD-dependent oxidoreductase [Pontibacter sp. SGAir0037]|uniref:phytoene desaturase family protein n=1 Tax=Pontibacter sp. SGAir0037 TaxID=2571030 RepID=UPI0010CD12A7|nr:NAD(P)/FAD-dependent oxidoreductase [Pontibacter sp. SGAir0037]QCR23898.1 FAD-dependent oxidoreductase [Pontibacter sp. SGAir0037]